MKSQSAAKPPLAKGKTVKFPEAINNDLVTVVAPQKDGILTQKALETVGMFGYTTEDERRDQYLEEQRRLAEE